MNGVYLMARMLHLYKFTISHGKRHTMHAHKPQAGSDWLNPNSLGPSQSLVALEIKPKIQLV